MWGPPNGGRKRKGWSTMTRSDVTPRACQTALQRVVLKEVVLKGVVLKDVVLKEVLLAPTTVEILHDENKQKYLQQQLCARDKAPPQHSAVSTVPRSHLRGVAESPKDLALPQWSTTFAPLVTTLRAASICARFLSKPPPSA